MNIKRFKKVVAVYLLLLIGLTLYVPMNVFFNGAELCVGAKEFYHDYGISYHPVWKAGYMNFSNAEIPDLEGLYDGYMKYEPHIPFIIAESILYFASFAGVSYIACKKE